MIGVDIVKISRIEKIYEKYEEKFLQKIFNDSEIEILKNKNFRIQSIAGFYATKEAVSKALGTGIGQTAFKDIEIFYKGAVPYAKAKGYIYNVSISHDGGMAIAFATKAHKYISEDMVYLFPKRDANSNKSTVGKVALIGGNVGVTGSICLSSKACLKTGSGLVYTIVPKDITDIVSIKLTEPIIKTREKVGEDFLSTVDAIGIGPGMGTDELSRKYFEEVMKLDKPILVDADGLTNLSKNLNLLLTRKKYTTVLTPHSGEFSRLTGISVEEIERNREKYSKKFAEKYGIILILKGRRSIITDGNRIHINESGNPGMATAGSGDVLTGIISSLLGRKMDVFDAAKLGVYIHGLAGDFARDKLTEECLIASDIINALPTVFKSVDRIF